MKFVAWRGFGGAEGDVNGRFSPVKSAGKPVPGVEVKVVDEYDMVVPAGEMGKALHDS